MVEYIDGAFKGIVAGLIAALFGIFRMVFTNNTKVKLLEQDMKHNRERVEEKIDYLVDHQEQALDRQNRILEHLIEKKNLD